MSDASSLEFLLGQLQARQSGLRKHGELVALENEGRDLARSFPEHPEPIMFVGSVLRQRFEWDQCSRFYLENSERFPDYVGMRYEAALVAIDSGDYARALGVLSGLADGLDTLSARHLRGFWRAAPMVGLYRKSIEAFRLWAAQTPGAANDALDARLRCAAANAEDPAIASVGVVSVGENCLPWIVGQRWGLRPSNSFLSQESPFNLAQTVTDSVTTLVDDGLYPLLDLRTLAASESDNEIPRPVNGHYRFDFNHEWGRRFVEQRFSRTLDRYEERIARLRSFITRKPVVYLHYTERDGDLVRLSEAFRRATAHDNYRLVIIDVWDGERSALPSDERTTYVRMPLPRSDYVWYRPDDIDSEEGIAFESGIQAVVMQAARSVHAALPAA